jgi:hypothetical protein
MNKIDDAWAILKRLPQQQQELAADAILDYAAKAHDLELSDEQAAEVRRRLSDPEARAISPDDLRARLRGP